MKEESIFLIDDFMLNFNELQTKLMQDTYNAVSRFRVLTKIYEREKDLKKAYGHIGQEFKRLKNMKNDLFDNATLFDYSSLNDSQVEAIVFKKEQKQLENL